MSLILRHPNGQYVLEWSNDRGEITRVDLVPKGQASSYRKRGEMRPVFERFPGVQFTVETR